MSAVQVWYVVGKDPNGRTTELAKFFASDHADSHLVALRGSAGSQKKWADLSVERREEGLEDQHPAHKTSAEHSFVQAFSSKKTIS